MDVKTCMRISAPKKLFTHAPACTFSKVFLHPIAQNLPHPHVCPRSHTKSLQFCKKEYNFSKILFFLNRKSI